MSYLKRPEELMCARSILIDIAVNPQEEKCDRLVLVFKLAKTTEVLSNLIVEIFESSGIVPNIFVDTASLLGEYVAKVLGTELREYSEQRSKHGLEPLPIRFLEG
ncbi:MAG: hypothetical protein EON58_20060, partial [Alphaproteobacteria bacterium]